MTRPRALLEPLYLLVPGIYLVVLVVAAFLSHTMSHLANGLFDDIFFFLVMPWALLVIVPVFSFGGSIFGTLIMASAGIPNALILGIIAYRFSGRRRRSTT